VTNAIQICGFREAYDLWGCARYCYPEKINKKEIIVDGLENKKNRFICAKDIQLIFDLDTKPMGFVSIEDCERCFNNPCTCENSKDEKNPYNVKREENLEIQKNGKDI
jgi:hypothetical protein